MMDDRRALIRALTLHVEGLRTLGVRTLPVTTTGPQSPPKADPPLADTVSTTRHGGSAKQVGGHGPQFTPEATRLDRLAQLARAVVACRRCSLYRTRTHAVISDGSPHAQLVFVGEAPGREEDLQGRPFVGAAGQLLTKMIVAIGMKREEVYICNVLKDRPPANRTPLPEEIDACRSFLEEQLALVQPRVICTLGAVATKTLLGPQVTISAVRGQVRDYRGVPVVPTFHPAYLLRNPSAKRLAWADLKRVKSLLENSP